MRVKRLVLSLACAGCLAGGGLAGPATSTATGAAAEAEQARQAKQIEERARQQAQDAVQQDNARREQAEKDAKGTRARGLPHSSCNPTYPEPAPYVGVARISKQR